MAVVCSLHQPQLAQRHAQRLVGLAGGRLRFDRPVPDVDDAATESLYRTDPPRSDLVETNPTIEGLADGAETPVCRAAGEGPGFARRT